MCTVYVNVVSYMCEEASVTLCVNRECEYVCMFMIGCLYSPIIVMYCFTLSSIRIVFLINTITLSISQNYVYMIVVKQSKASKVSKAKK